MKTSTGNHRGMSYDIPTISNRQANCQTKMEVSDTHKMELV